MPLVVLVVLGAIAVAPISAYSARAQLRQQAFAGAAQIRKCIPDTLGSEYVRKHQIFAFDEGRITQPHNRGLCLTATSSYTVQNPPGPVLHGRGWGIDMQPCSDAQTANQTWSLNGHGQIFNPALSMCIDMAGYGTAPGAPAQMWPCTAPDTNSCPPTHACPATNCTCVANQQFRWEPNGNVINLLSRLCFDCGSTGGAPKPCELPSLQNTTLCDTSLAPAVRAAALVAEANLTEQVANLGVSTVGFPRLHIPAPKFGEALHGVCSNCGMTSPNSTVHSTGCATSFPHALSLAATFNRSLWTMVGEVIGLEGRALQNQHAKVGVAYFAPNLNLYRSVLHPPDSSVYLIGALTHCMITTRVCDCSTETPDGAGGWRCQVKIPSSLGITARTL